MKRKENSKEKSNEFKFYGDITLEEIFNLHQITMYDNVVDAISANYKDASIHEIKIISIILNNIEYNINLSRSKYISGLENAIYIYEKLEAYEKCLLCLNIINELKKTRRLY